MNSSIQTFLSSRNFHYSSKLLLQRYSSHNKKPKLDVLEVQLENVLKNSKIAHNGTLLLSVSGGCDSVAMLHMFQKIKCLEEWKKLDLKIIHFNHKMRVESEEEAVFVQGLGDNYGIEVFHRVLDYDNPTTTTANITNKRSSNNFQDQARNWRRQEIYKLLDTFPIPSSDKFFVTAHHHGDQVETILLKLLRGTHITNIRKMTTRDGQCLRPFLNVTKEALQQYLTSRSLPWREDASNQTTVYKRNAIRLDLIPLMSSLAGGEDALSRRLFALSNQSAEVHDLIAYQMEHYASSYATTTSYGPYHLLHLSSSLSSIPALIVKEILFRWIAQHTDISLDSLVLQEVYLLATENTTNKITSAVTISELWDVQRVGHFTTNSNNNSSDNGSGNCGELRLIPREFVLTTEKNNLHENILNMRQSDVRQYSLAMTTTTSEEESDEVIIEYPPEIHILSATASSAASLSSTTTTTSATTIGTTHTIVFQLPECESREQKQQEKKQKKKVSLLFRYARAGDKVIVHNQYNNHKNKKYPLGKYLHEQVHLPLYQRDRIPLLVYRKEQEQEEEEEEEEVVAMILPEGQVIVTAPFEVISSQSSSLPTPITVATSRRSTVITLQLSCHIP